MAKKYTKSEIEGMIKNLKEKEKKARSKWGKAVLQDAQWLLENVIEGYDEPYELSEKLVLNGAENWNQFSWGGSALVYNGEIAEHYSTPSEAKNFWGLTKDGGVKRDTNTAGEHLLDIQARALRQAWWAIRDEMNGTTEFSMSLCEFEEKKGKSNFDMDKDEYWGLLIEHGIATEDELQLITNINGYSEETLDDVLYARTGYRSWEQYCEANDIENEDEDDDNMSIIEDTKGVLKSTGKLAGNIVKNTTEKGGLLMF